VLDAREAIRAEGLADIDITYVHGWHTHEKFIAPNAEHVRAALAQLPPDLRSRARVVFTAHSIPVQMAQRSKYTEQLLDSAREVARAAGVSDWVLVYQSRSGRPQDPWLEPDVCDYLRAAHAEGLEAAVLCPIGFLCDHVEVLYDLDREAAQVASEIGLAMRRAESVNDNPVFIDMMAEVIGRTIERYQSGRPLPILHVRATAAPDVRPTSSHPPPRHASPTSE
jgi:ferrochelatase